MFSVKSASMIENVQAHPIDTSIWSISSFFDNRGFISAGSDKSVKFWKFELLKNEINTKYCYLFFIKLFLIVF